MTMMQTDSELSYGRIFRFWLPLAATWLMMSVEGPFLAAIIARMGETKLNLAAYGVAYSFGLVTESPVIMLMSASTALVRDRRSYLRLRNFSLVLCFAVTLMILLLVFPPVFTMVAERLIGLTPEVARLTHGATLLLLPWPAAIGLRRFYQGVLIRSNQTRFVAYATALRVAGMAGAALGLYHYGGLKGAYVGGLSLSAGVVLEAVATRLLARRAVTELLESGSEEEGEAMSYREIAGYYLPLALTPFIGLSVYPMVTFFLGKSLFPVESLAVMPVLYALTFVFRAVGLSFQEVAIALVGSRLENYRRVRNFACLVGGGATLLLVLIAYTPLSGLWFHQVSGLSRELAEFSLRPLRIMALIPALTVLIGFQRSILMTVKVTAPITFATAIEAFGIFALMAAFIAYPTVPGAVAAALSYILGRLMAIAFLGRPFSIVLKEHFVSAPERSPDARGI